MGEAYPAMVEVPWRGIAAKIPRRITRLDPKAFRLETTTVWTFPTRGRWASHTPSYRGNWAPEVPRNLILRYTEEGETVLDPMMGGGTTMVECLLTGRQGIGVDIEPAAVRLAAENLGLGHWPVDWDPAKGAIGLFEGDARRLDRIEDASLALVAMHPPYANIVRYGGESRHNLSWLSIDAFVAAMSEVAAEAYRVLAPGRHCAVLIGDTRRHKHYVPLSVRVLERFLDAGFLLREDVIKLQHRMKGTRERWRGSKYDFHLIAHEHLYVFRKPEGGESVRKFRHSVKWW